MSRMTSEKLFEAIGEVEEEYLKDISIDALDIYNRTEKRRVRRSWMIKIASVAACLAIVVLGIRSLSDNQGMLPGTQGMEACCSSSTIIGEIVGDMYYYTLSEEGIYAYSIIDGTNKKIIDSDQYHDFMINDYGIFYSSKNEVYMREHQTENTRIVYTADAYADIRIYFVQLENTEDILIEVYDYGAQTNYERVLDGNSGEDITEQYPDISSEEVTFEEDDRQNESHIYCVGDRKFLFEIVYRLEEDGIWRSRDLFYEWKDGGWQRLTPVGEEKDYDSYVEFWNEDMIIVEYDYYMETKKVVYTASGKDVKLPYNVKYRWFIAAKDDYIFYEADVSGGLYKPMVYDVEAEESWQLKCYADIECKKECSEEVLNNFYSYTTDGKYVISNTADTSEQFLWKLNYDEDGRPASLSLLAAFDTL